MAYCQTCGHWHPSPHFFHLQHGYPDIHGPYYTRIESAGVRSDEDIKRDVKDALFWDTWVDSDQVNVEVANGIVVLAGTIDSSSEKRAAEDDASNVPGVVDVQNRLQIKK